MIDHATKERRAWLREQPFPKAKRAPERPANWLLAKPVNDRFDPEADKEYEARAAMVWEKTRAIGGICG